MAENYVALGSDLERALDLAVKMKAERDALQAFKDYVHKRLDEAGVPTHPDGPHSAQGCRIGDRLDLALAVIPAARKILRTLNYHIDNSPSNALPVYTGIADLRDVLKAVSPTLHPTKEAAEAVARDCVESDQREGCPSPNEYLGAVFEDGSKQATHKGED